MPLVVLAASACSSEPPNRGGHSQAGTGNISAGTAPWALLPVGSGVAGTTSELRRSGGTGSGGTAAGTAARALPVAPAVDRRHKPGGGGAATAGTGGGTAARLPGKDDSQTQ